MREIKFRAWWKDAHLMEEVVTLRDGEISILVPLKPNSLGQKYEHQVLEEGQYELMQFTGLTDKNGKEIYEGDIVSDGESSGGRVEWEPTTAVFTIREGSRYFAFNRGDIGRPTRLTFTEVIGNIYENPELLAA